MSRARLAADWERDLREARPVEAAVAGALAAHPCVERLVDGTRRTDRLDFEFSFRGGPVRLDVKQKRSPLSAELQRLWPTVPEAELLVLDETALRSLMWGEGMGYLLVHDLPCARWLILGPWELLLAPHRRYERWGDRGHGPFRKGKVLVDLRTASASTPLLSIDRLLDVVQATRHGRHLVGAWPVASTSVPSTSTGPGTP